MFGYWQIKALSAYPGTHYRLSNTLYSCLAVKLTIDYINAE